MICGSSALRRILALGLALGTVLSAIAAAVVPLSARAQSTDAPQHQVPFPEPTSDDSVVAATAPAAETRPPVDLAAMAPFVAPAAADAIHVKFSAGSAVRVEQGRLRGLRRADQAIVDAALRTAGASITKLFSRPEAALDADRRRIERETGAAQVDLSLWFRVSLDDPRSAAGLAEALNSIPVVEAAIAEPELAPAAMAQPPPAIDYSPNQAYRSPAPAGVDADYAAAIAGGTGANVVVSDLEYSWNTTHEDLGGALGAELVNGAPEDPFSSTDHGTAVVGIVAAEDNGFGLTGLAPDAELQLVNVFTTSGAALADAIDLAAANSDPGDVLLIEQQLCPVTVVGGFCGPGWLPVEWFPSYYDAIVAATNKGVIVVQPAGNGTRDIDDILSFPDSGAIIVGGGNPSDSCTFFGAEPARGRLDFSNWGTRVDLQGHGACVWTTGAEGGAVDPGAAPDAQYTALFSGTSSAAAVVAGAAASLSSIAIEAGDPLGVDELRALLRATGSPQDRSVDPRPIGPLPDLRSAIESYLTAPHGAPANDAFEQPAIVDGLPTSITGPSLGSTVQIGEPISTCGSTDTTLWYSFTPVADMRVRVAASSTGPTPSLAVWEIVAPDVLGQVACRAGTGAGPSERIVEAEVRAGTTYMMQLGNTAGADVTIDVRGAPSCDLDGDGVGDILVGAPGEKVKGHVGAGAINVVYGRAKGSPGDRERAPAVTQASSGVKGRARAGDGFGTSVGCGDINGDGYDDAVVGVPGDDFKSNQGTGSVQVFFGSTAGIGRHDQRVTQASGVVPGKAEPGDAFGAAVAVGDVNGDGYDDIVVGAPGEAIGPVDGAGAVTLLLGGSTGVDVSAGSVAIHQDRPGVPGSADSGDGLGEALAVGDTDGDGSAEIFIGVPGEGFGEDAVGVVIVVPGSPDGPELRASSWFAPTQAGIATPAVAGVRFGAALALGDVNGDANIDLLVGVPGGSGPSAPHQGGGWIDIVPGSASGVGLHDSVRLRPGRRGVPGDGRPGDMFGAAVLAVDIDGSGVDDVVAGSPGRAVGAAANAGSVSLLALDADFRVVTATELTQDSPGMKGRAQRPDRFGAALTGHDLDADGLADLVIAAPRERVDGEARAGQVHVVPGSVTGFDLGRDRLLHQGTPGVGSALEARDSFGVAVG